MINSREWEGLTMYFLVLLNRSTDPPSIEVDHEAFVDSLIRRNPILLGGPFPTPLAPNSWAGYVLACAGEDDARSITATDPLVANGLAIPTITAWDLVAINTAAIDPNLATAPNDPRLNVAD